MSSMFYLHSSANHAFALTRKAKQGYSFSGPDLAVSWDAVRIVKYLAPSTDATGNQAEETCPICLDTFTCPRITKCGHCFCLPCLLRHVHTSTAANASKAVKCPCCGLPIHVDDIRPVTIESVLPPKVHSKMKLVKLHRTKECPSPYLPQRGQWKRSSPHTCPNVTDEDAMFARFTYVDPDAFQVLLKINHRDLARYLEELQRVTPQDLEVLFVQMSLERVRTEGKTAWGEIAEEQSLMERYSQSSSGMHQPIPEYLFASNYAHNNAQIDNSLLDDSSGAFLRRHESVGSESEARSRGESFGSEADHTRSRGESMGSEGDARLGRPNRGYSMDSADSDAHHARQQQQQRRRERRLPNLQASVYLEDHASQFYQSPDGQLCYLSKFNMNCLTADFSTHIPQEPVQVETASSNEMRKRNPLPDVVEGKVMEVETLHLTTEMRKRMPFLSHLPFYTDILFVELDLNPILSYETQRQFKKEFEKRKQRRKNKVIAEKKVDRQLQRREEERVNALKARMQRIDPGDEFFQIPEELLVGEDFGPAIGAQSPPSQPQPSPPALNFSAVVHTPSSMAVTEDAFPSLGGGTSTAFPSLGGSAGGTSAQPSWGRGWHATNAAPRAANKVQELSTSPPQNSEGRGKKSKKKEKILLFSNGGQRGGF